MATSTLQTDLNNDLVLIDDRNLNLLVDVDAIVQDVRAATLMRTGEDIYNVKSGVDYMQYIFSPQPSFDDARRSLISAIQTSPDVLTVDSLTIDVADNIFNFVAQIKTTFGRLTVENK